MACSCILLVFCFDHEIAMAFRNTRKDWICCPYGSFVCKHFNHGLGVDEYLIYRCAFQMLKLIVRGLTVNDAILRPHVD